WDEPTPTPTPTPSSSTPVTATPTSASGSPSGSASAVPSASASATPTPTPSAAACQLARLRSTVQAPSRVATRGSTVTFTVTVTNQGAACVWNLKTLPVEVTVDSGSDRIWSTGDCAAWAPKGSHEVAPGKSASVTVKWPTKRSASGSCSLSKEQLGTGTYVASAQVKGGATRQYVMQLTD
ncbi:MAG: hypothetical protein L0L18_06590, partial [Acidipropionibacterium jensenii]|nr:hypothetical protein [Acidipropionibacterium jensenii]